MVTKAQELKDKLHAVKIRPLSEEPAQAHEQQQRPIDITSPERQMMVRMWALEDEVRRLLIENAELREQLATAT